MLIEGKSVVITGGGNGIGRALALRFAELGVRAVTVADLDGDWAGRAAAKIEQSGVPALGVACDVGDPTAIETMVDAAEAAYGPVRHLLLERRLHGHGRRPRCRRSTRGAGSSTST